MLILVGLGWFLFQRPFNPFRPIDLESTKPPHFEADLNTAPGYELQLLPGVGPKSVQDIEAHREKRGLFQNAEELDDVKGFGQVKVEQLKENVIVRPTSEKGLNQ